MRTVSLNFRKAMFAQESGEMPIFLLTITHPSLASPILLSTDATSRITTDPLVYGTTSRSNTYLYAGVDLALPDESDRTAPAMKMTISNVARDIVPLARSIGTPAQVKIEVVLASAPDTVEITLPQFDMTNLNYDAASLAFDLTMDSLTTEPFPAGNFSPAYFPALFF